MDTNPAAAVNNRHHTDSYYNQEDFDYENFPRGLGDPDYFGYPGMAEMEAKD